MSFLRLTVLTVFALLFAAEPQLRAAESSPATTNQLAQPIAIVGIHNAFRVTDHLFSGSQPEGDASFAALAKLGVKTIISVDGSQPDVETARTYGLKYLHLPFGYDGIPTNRIAELVKAMTSEPGPFFVHCHHGKHRGPAAVAVMCEAAANWSAAQAESWLRAAGTSAEYPGLYRAAREFIPPSAAALAAIKNLPEVAKPTSVVATMIAIDTHLDHLKLMRQSGWKTPAKHLDLSPEQEATQLWEQFRELARLTDTAQRDDDYRKKLAEAESLAASLRDELRSANPPPSLDNTLKRINDNCTACHQSHRNQ